jgi:hypothetical protein
MGKKSAQPRPAPPPPAPPPARRPYALVVAAALIVGAIAVIAYRRSGPAAPSAAGAREATARYGEEPTGPPAWVKFGPHVQATLPPLDLPGYDTPRPREVIEAAYRFAAEHPEVLSYVPCFCGCEHAGHRGNEDCFVRERAMNGDVLTWEPHGMECAICIDVATRAREMYAKGASVRQIHDAVQADFGSQYTTMTPTPTPPASR